MHKCDYHEPTSEAQWQGHDKLARNTRHGKPIKYACHLCRHFLSNPVRIESVPTQEKPITTNEMMF